MKNNKTIKLLQLQSKLSKSCSCSYNDKYSKISKSNFYIFVVSKIVFILKTLNGVKTAPVPAHAGLKRKKDHLMLSHVPLKHFVEIFIYFHFTFSCSPGSSEHTSVIFLVLEYKKIQGKFKLIQQ